MKKLFFLGLAFLTLSSHELFLKSNSHFMETNSASELYLFNGTFDESENIITRDRIINAKIIGPKFELTPDTSDYYDKGEATYLKFTTGKSGSYVAGISTLPRVIELSGTDFTAYLEHEGLEQVINAREKGGITDQTAKEKYSKHVKTLLQVGKKRSDQYGTVLGYPIEFIPLDNPYEQSMGKDVRFKLLVNGDVLPNQTVHYSYRSNKEDASREEQSLKTDANGEFSIQLTTEGQWYVATIHMIESTEEGLDYESNWATLTFEVR